MKKFIKRYWITATIFSIIIGEILIELIFNKPIPLFSHPFTIILYYAIISLLFAYSIERWGIYKNLIIFALYGFFVETFVFKTTRGITDLAGLAFFGVLYIILFGVPYYLTGKLN